MRYTIRIVRANNIDLELERIINFYEENKDPNNAERDALTLLKAGSDRNFFLVENDHSKLVGVSGYFRLGSDVEKGGSRIVLNGYGLQEVLNWCIACHLFAFHPPKGILFTKIAAKNSGSIHVIKKCGYKEFTPDNKFLTWIGGKQKTINLSEKKFFGLPKYEIENNAKKLLDLHHSPVITNKNTNETIILNFDYPLLRNDTLRNILQSMAKGDFRFKY